MADSDCGVAQELPKRSILAGAETLAAVEHTACGGAVQPRREHSGATQAEKSEGNQAVRLPACAEAAQG